MQRIRKFMCFMCAMFCVFGIFGHVSQGVAEELDQESQRLEQEFLDRYKALYESGLALKKGIRSLRPPQNRLLTEEELQPFWAMMEELYAEYPEYRDKDSQQDEASDIARITGLPEKELARYQLAKGTLGLRKLTLSVKTDPHEEWLRLYFHLIDIPEKIENFSVIPPQHDPESSLEQARSAFYEAGQAYTASRGTLIARFDEFIQAEERIEQKTQFALSRQKYLVLDDKAARIDQFGRRGYSDWFKEYTPEHSKRSAFLAERLNINFADLAYIEKKSGRYGLKKFLKQCDWIENAEELGEKLNDL